MNPSGIDCKVDRRAFASSGARTQPCDDEPARVDRRFINGSRVIDEAPQGGRCPWDAHVGQHLRAELLAQLDQPADGCPPLSASCAVQLLERLRANPADELVRTTAEFAARGGN